MKVKARVPRTYDEDGFKLRAGCLCFKDESKREVSVNLHFKVTVGEIAIFKK